MIAGPLDAEPQAAPRRKTLQQWLAWQRELHPNSVDLGLDRVRKVAHMLQLTRFNCPVITVAGTNGKGSTVAILESILIAAGLRVASYTSPHLLRYNERVRFNAEPVTDRILCTAFDAVEQARQGVGQSLSFFEFGTLAALHLFSARSLDAVILEVGLGGRLDAVNIVDADIAVITSIGIDHTDWLGTDRDSIGVEKAGVFRPGRPAVCAEPDPPGSIPARALELAAPMYQIGTDFGFVIQGNCWSWRGPDKHYIDLPLPALIGDHQVNNAAGALMALDLLSDSLPVTAAAIRAGLREAVNPGRLQKLPAPFGSSAEWWLDVCHNPQGAMALAQWLKRQPAGKTFAILGMLRDKDTKGIVNALDDCIDHWYTVGLMGERGQSAAQLGQRLREAGVPAAAINSTTSVQAACRAAAASATLADRVVVCGSISAVAKVLRSQQLGGQ